MTFNSFDALQNEIMHRADEALKNEVSDMVKEKLKEHVQTDVYDAYGSQEPLIYSRRKANGGLLDDSNITSKLNTRSGKDGARKSTLTVRDEAHIEGPRIEGYSEQPGQTPLAALLESGKVKNPWTGYRGSWTKARKFVTKTQSDINSHYTEILSKIKERINSGK